MSAERRLGALIERLERGGELRSVAVGSDGPVGSREISAVTSDSRRVVPGTLFVAVPGQHADGHDFLGRAEEAGAAAAIVERPQVGLSVPQLVVSAARRTLATAAAWFEGDPSHRLGVIGVTGTDGKTTTGYLLRSMLDACGQPAGMVGTVDVVVGGRHLGNPGRSTTPEAPELQAHLAAMLAAGDRFAIVESTSHGLAQDRVAEVAYDVGVLTNVSHEHLEFHRTHEAYRAAKRRLFERLATMERNPDKGWPKAGVVNRDDRWWEEYAAATRDAGARLLTYGTDEASEIRATRVEEDARELRIQVQTGRWSDQVTLRLAGRFNVHNALACIAVGEALDLDPAAMRRGLEALEGVPGRMERIDAGQPFGVVVDYAHTSDALGKVLDNLAPVASAGGGGLICVVGSAGERDVQKRPMIGRVAAERCRLVVVADEDPRSEDRDSILEQIAAGAEAVGARRGQDLLVIADRAAAISAAVEQARAGDIVLLAGKGHERTIEMASGPVPWDEAGAARAALAALGYG